MNSAEKLRLIKDLLYNKQTKEARLLIDELIHEEPRNIEVWYWRGVCENLEGKLDLAEKDFRSVIRQKPYYGRAFFGLGKVLENKGKLKEAIAAYQQAASLGNRNAAKIIAQYGASPVAERRSVSHRSTYQQPPEKRIDHSTSMVELKSEKGINYTRLRDLLVAGKWQKADEETEKLMCRAAGKNKDRWGETFPCADLITIDNLWTHYSQRRFGFSVQAEIWRRRMEGGRKFNSIIWRKFGSYVGWLHKGLWLCKSELSFEESAPRGHLPAGIWSPLKSEVGLNLLEAWWILRQKQMKVKAKRREAGWHGVALINVLSRLEHCKSELNRSKRNENQTIPGWLIAIIIAAITVILLG